MSEWKPIATFRDSKRDRRVVDLWLIITPSLRSFAMSDAFRVVDAWQEDGKWFHTQSGQKKELFKDYVTHWMPIPKPPRRRKS